MLLVRLRGLMGVDIDYPLCSAGKTFSFFASLLPHNVRQLDDLVVHETKLYFVTDLVSLHSMLTFCSLVVKRLLLVFGMYSGEVKFLPLLQSQNQ